MGKNLKIKLAVDLLMTGALLFLMPYEPDRKGGP